MMGYSTASRAHRGRAAVPLRADSTEEDLLEKEGISSDLGLSKAVEAHLAHRSHSRTALSSVCK